MTQPDDAALIAGTLRDIADQLTHRRYTGAELTAIHDALAALSDATSQGLPLDLDDRLARFVDQILTPVPDAGPGVPTPFVPFSTSAYTGTINPLAPRRVDVARLDDRVVARVELGAALEGAPGRAHGGAVAAMFDDLMGAVQRITGRPAYTRTLEVRYLAPWPTDREVEVVAREAAVEERSYTVVAEARCDDRPIATSEAVFARIPDGANPFAGPGATPAP